MLALDPTWCQFDGRYRDMSSLEQCHYGGEQFLRYALPFVAKAMDSLPSLPSFKAEPSNKKGRYRFVELKEPNWWQLPNELRSFLLDLILREIIYESS